ncbi:hypothetical protein [Sphingomonas sp. M1-B02]|uniref:hypothetical protein n=1 Tax=Sphingomonas sp. M1-B02 TaxID=3114300 RepID=UPI00223F2295|nr:hypothetical protein [Sphingomonas sp. S6-11]UZK65710.1 hypothetical protein OKW87_14515 [Sphingomonas sp. S6-11]
MDWGSVPDWIVAITAVVGVVAGLWQLNLIRREEHRSAQFERGKLLLEIDREFESSEVSQSRQKMGALRNRFESEVEKREPPVTKEEKDRIVAEKISKYADEVWTRSRTYDGDPSADKDSASDEYKLLMRVALWCETVGHLCERNLLPEDDVLDLYDQLVINVIGNLQAHIALRAERGANSRYLENALALCSKATGYKAMREEKLPRRPARSLVDWKR